MMKRYTIAIALAVLAVLLAPTATACTTNCLEDPNQPPELNTPRDEVAFNGQGYGEFLKAKKAFLKAKKAFNEDVPRLSDFTKGGSVTQEARDEFLKAKKAFIDEREADWPAKWWDYTGDDFVMPGDNVS